MLSGIIYLVVGWVFAGLYFSEKFDSNIGGWIFAIIGFIIALIIYIKAFNSGDKDASVMSTMN